MDNKAIAGILYETADLLEIDGEDSFRIRSYRNAAEAIEAQTQQIADIIEEPKKVLAIAGIGKGMVANLQEMFKEGKLSLHQELLKKYHPSMLELLKIQGLGPKTIALIWSAYQVSDLDGVGQARPRRKDSRAAAHGRKAASRRLLKAIEDYRRIAGRFLLDDADREAQKIIDHLKRFPGRREDHARGLAAPRTRNRRRSRHAGHRQRVLRSTTQREKLIEHVIKLPRPHGNHRSGENKVSFRLRSGMQVDVRLLPPESFGAAMQYFTGSKAHNVALRQRALKMGYTLNEYSLAELETEKPVAGKTEEEIYAKLKLDYIPPRCAKTGRNRCRREHTLPELITQDDIRATCTCTPSKPTARNTIEEMAAAAKERGYKYMAITDHSKNLAFANGLDDKRAVEHIERIRAATIRSTASRIFAGIEVDILADGELDLSDSVLEQMDVVIASVHSAFNQSRSEMTDRLLRAARQSEHVDPRTSHRTPAAPPRRLSLRHGRRPQSRREEQSRDGTERLSRPPRPRRPQSAPGQRARREDRHQHRLTSHLTPGQNRLASCRPAAPGSPKKTS